MLPLIYTRDDKITESAIISNHDDSDRGRSSDSPEDRASVFHVSLDHLVTCHPLTRFCSSRTVSARQSYIDPIQL